MQEGYSSSLLESAVEAFTRLPGIGRKTALRLALYLLKQDKAIARTLGESVIRLREEAMFCKTCFNISDNEICSICANPSRTREIVCVVQDIRDVMAIEGTGQYKGRYHVLGGIISPMDGIGPSDLNIAPLIERVKNENIEEVILALPGTVEGDTTNFYIFKQLSGYDLKITTIARGIAVGDELEYADEVTLGRSIRDRLPYDTGNGAD
ncbi:MAG: recombination mediator RecR [Bacteroidales bacterium]